MILIYPPVAKPCEPPAGLARLSGVLTGQGIRHEVLDANLEGLRYLLECAPARQGDVSDKWTARALRNLSKNISALKGGRLYHNLDRYKRAVRDVSRLLETSASGHGALVSLANYQHDRLSPLRSADLVRAAESPEQDPFYPYFKKRLTGLLEKSRTSMAGFSLNYLSQALGTFSMIGFLKRECPELTVVLGGGLVTSWTKNPGWRNPFKGLVDHIVSGPGESRLLSLAGIKEAEKGHFTPDYGAMPLNDYLSPGLILPYSASSGCWWNKCSFCPEKAEGNPYIPVRPDRAIADIGSLVIKTSPVLIHLLDSSVSPALMRAFIKTPPCCPWYGFARISPDLTDLDFCIALRRSGCLMLQLGLESGAQGVLDDMQKGIDIETASLALKNLKRAGIAAYVYLIFGTPSETLTGARKTLEFTVRHNEEIDFLNLAIFNMPVCAPEATALETSGFYEGDLSLYTDFSHPKGWDRKKVRHFLENEFKRHPAVSSILKKEPPVFTSNHAPFFAMP